MPSFTEQSFFYELLVRGGPEGIKGAHVVNMKRTLRDGVLFADTPGDARPVALADGQPGEPLAAVLSAATVQALATVEDQAAQIATLTAEKQAEATAKAQAIAERDAALADAAALRAKYESPASNNGVPDWVYASQAYKALTVAGKLEAVQAALAAAAAQPGEAGQAGRLAQIDFEKSARFYRNHPTVAMFIASGLFTSTQVDDLFKLAATFQV